MAKTYILHCCIRSTSAPMGKEHSSFECRDEEGKVETIPYQDLVRMMDTRTAVFYIESEGIRYQVTSKKNTDGHVFLKTSKDTAFRNYFSNLPIRTTLRNERDRRQ